MVSGFIKYGTYGLYNWEQQESGGRENENIVAILADYTDKAMVATDATLQGAQRISNSLSNVKYPVEDLSRVPVLGVVGKIVSGAVAGHQLYEGWQKHNYIEMAEGAGTIIVSMFFPEFTIAYAIITYGIDYYREYQEE
jgi:hypothetical protein